MGILFGNREEITDQEMQKAIGDKEMEIAFREGANFQAEAVAAERKRKLQLGLRKNVQTLDRTGTQLGRTLGRAVVAAPRPSFTQEQIMLGQMFGQGDKIWGINNEPVQINNDLNSSRSDPWDETGGMFGFGPFGQRSGLF